MRKLLILAVLTFLTGCQGGGLFTSRQKDRDRDRSSRAPDPLMSPDLEEQKKWDRAKFSYPESGRDVAPPTGIDKPSPSGR